MSKTTTLADLHVERVVGVRRGATPSNTLFCTVAIHGNETAGLVAARRVLEALDSQSIPIRGEFVVVAGNREALRSGRRYVSVDLNRAFPTEWESSAAVDTPEPEASERAAILAEFDAAVARARGVVHHLDLHTTSAPSAPFAVIGDTLRNRTFARRFPIPIILGLEEQVDGSLIEYTSREGHVSVCVEAGRHEAPETAARHEAVLWVALVAAGCVAAEDVPDHGEHLARLRAPTRGFGRFMEVRYRHGITKADAFVMKPGYENFAPVSQGEVVATDRSGPVRAPEGGRIMFPLYQEQGDDGFFIGRDVARFWLVLSRVLRRLRIGDLAHWLPGVHRHPDRPDAVIVDTRIARWAVVEIFHLLGYRRHRQESGRLVMSRRR